MGAAIKGSQWHIEQSLDNTDKVARVRKPVATLVNEEPSFNRCGSCCTILAMKLVIGAIQQLVIGAIQQLGCSER